MNRYEATFQRCARTDEVAFVPFAVAGDPSIPVSEDILKTYVDAGADVLEVGYPFSDPVADGPINQRAGMRAIAAGLDHAKFFGLMSRIRSYAPEVPIGILLYANTVIHLGVKDFCSRAADAGIDSLLVADLPPEESQDLETAMHRSGLATVYIVTELTPAERVRRICKRVTGFVYVVSRLGPTGTQTDFSSSTATTIAGLRKTTDKPLCVGFGLTKPEHIRAVRAAGAHGAIVGSALVETIEKNAGNRAALLRAVKKQVAAYKEATKSPR